MTGAVLANLRDLRVTIPQIGKAVKDNWRKAAMQESPSSSSEEWTRKCVFYEGWADASLGEEVNQANRTGDLPGGLVFTNVPEYSLVDDLSGEPLTSPLVTLAKREEVTDMHRREVWREKPIENCVRDTGKPLTPVR